MTTIFENYDKKYKITEALSDLSEDLTKTTFNSEYKESFRLECTEIVSNVTKLILFLEKN